MSRNIDLWQASIMGRLESIGRGYANGVSLGFLDRSGCTLTQNVRSVLSAFNPNLSEDDLDATLRDALMIVDRASAEDGSRSRHASERWDVGELTGLLLASVVLIRRPEVIVEVGVANGTSTRILLAAMNSIGSGQLHSFDIDARCAHVVGPALAGRWQFTLLPRKRTQALNQLGAQVGHVGPIDLWFSDADHTFAWQKLEWQLAMKSLTASGLLVADDIDATPAWPMATGGSGTVALIDGRKVTGITSVEQIVDKSA